MRPPLTKDPIDEIRRNWQKRGWSSAAEGAAAVTSIMRTQQILMGRAQEILKPFGLTFARFELLSLLSHSREQRMLMNRASALLQVHPTSITNAVDRLEKAGLAQRRPHQADRRAILLILSPEGKQVADQATEALNERLFERTGFTAEQLEKLNRLLADFRRISGDFEA